MYEKQKNTNCKHDRIIAPITVEYMCIFSYISMQRNSFITNIRIPQDM